MKKIKHSHSEYLREIFENSDEFRKLVNRTAKELKMCFPNTEYIAVSGVSGITVGTAVALKLKKGLIVVRKQGEDSHSSVWVEGCPRSDVFFEYIILDDFVSSGHTAKYIYDRIKFSNANAAIGGIYQYHEHYRRPYDGYEFMLGIKNV